MPDPLKRIIVVLVRPTRAGNIGAAARALKNMGLTRLVLVDPVADPRDSEAYRMGYGAHDLLERARVVKTLAQAVGRCRLVVGTTARTHKGYGRPTPLPLAARRILARAAASQVAVVFGPESSGLSNENIALCQLLVAIPTAAAHRSLNLAQAVLAVAYELRRARLPPRRSDRSRTPVTSDQGERFYHELNDLLAQIGFLKGTQGRHILADLRRVFGRAELDARELRILRGMLRQTRWALVYRDACSGRGPEEVSP